MRPTQELGKGCLPVCLPVNVVHAKRLDAVIPQDLLLARIHVAQADVDELPRADAVIVAQPPEVLGLVLPREPRQEADGHAVDVPGVARLGRVDVGVGVDPDDGDLAAAEPLAHGLRGPRHGPDGDRVVPAQRQHHAALARVRVHLRAEPLRHAAHRLRVLHVPVRRVVAVLLLRVRVHLVVPVQLVVQLVAQLRQQPRFDERRRGCVHAGFALFEGWLCKYCVVWRREGEGRGGEGRKVNVNVKGNETYLSSCETNGYDAEVCGVGEELGLHHGGVHLDDLVINGVYVVER